MNSLDQLNKFDAENFENWLRVQLIALYGNEVRARYAAFDFRDLGVPRGDSHIDALHRLFRRLSDQGKAQFQAGLERLLRNACYDELSRDAMADVIQLIGLTKYLHAFNAFVSILGYGAWGENHPELIYDALSVLMMFEGSDEAYETTKALATSRNFPDNMVFDAYLILARSRPEKARENFTLLGYRFDSVCKNIEDSGDIEQKKQLDARWDSLVRVVTSLPLSQMVSDIATIEDCSTIFSSRSIGRLYRNLLIKENAPLMFQWSRDLDEGVLVDRAQPKRMESIKNNHFLPVYYMTIGQFGMLEDRYESYCRVNADSIGPKACARLENICSPLRLPTFGAMRTAA